jgi:bifunctional N-acetylglutamate synthase/kinase
MEPAEAVLRFLAGVGKGSEAEFYLRLFRGRSRVSFATLVVDADTMRENVDGVALDLRLLHALSLTPVVVLGFYDGAAAQPDAAILQSKLGALHVPSALIARDESRASVTPARVASVTAAAESGEIPIVCLDGPGSQLTELAGMLSELQTHKLIFLRNEGGLELEGQLLSVVNLSDEFGTLWARPDWDNATRTLLTASRRIVLELVAHELLVTITSPLSLLHELFTVKGAGTLLRRGARVHRHEGLAGVDMVRLQGMLESSFGKTLRPNALSREFAAAYVEERYRGAALVMNTRLGSYLSKFAVTREAQGEGLGRDLWQALIAEHPVLFWRARSNNAIRSWYEKQCDGRVRAREWTVYFKGLAPERIPEAIGHALSQPLDF